MTRNRRGWTVFAAIMPLTLVNLFHVVRDRADVAGMWPYWRPMILDLLLVAAGAVAVATVAFGVHAWREAERGDHA